MRSLLIKCTTGVEDPERVNQAFTVAATALAAGARVSLWLTGEATWLATPGAAEGFALDGAAPLADSRDLILAEGRLVVCTQCAARRSLTERSLLPGAVLAGSASFVEEALAEGVQALVY